VAATAEQVGSGWQSAFTATAFFVSVMPFSLHLPAQRIHPQAWGFAQSMEHRQTMGKSALRDHAALMLSTIATDLQTPQTADEQVEKSTGMPQAGETYAETHADRAPERWFD
jgi:hypothetical protein